MRYFNPILIALGTLFSPLLHALDVYLDALYWQASETVEWALTNNFNPSNQVISYKNFAFSFAPGFRAGIGLQNTNLSSRLLYTHYRANTQDAASGTVISAFNAGKFVQTFSRAAQAKFTIDFNVLDADLYKEIAIEERLFFRPVLGLRGAWINQGIITDFQGVFNYTERVHNNFTGFGPKMALESQYIFYKQPNYSYGLIADFSTSYLWGNWAITDSLTQSNSAQISNVLVGKRDFGAVTVQGRLGVNLTYLNSLVTLAYEVSDWFNQYQVFDNSTGARNNDLILQGLSLSLSHRW